MTTETEAWVRFYESEGITYFPLYGVLNGACRCVMGKECQNTGKHPIYRWKGQPARMPTGLDNIGISTDNLVVIDLDDDVSEAVLAEYPTTFTTTTGHGFHLWYRASERKAVKSLVGWKRKVDIRAVGGVLVVPPSKHRTGAEYRAYNDSPIVTVPDTLLYQLPERGSDYTRTGSKAATVAVSDTPPMMYPMVARLITDMLEWQDGRNVTLFKVACRFYEMATKGLLGDDALSEITQAALSTGLTEDEIQRTLASAKRQPV